MRPIALFVIFVGLGSLSCQTYQTGLQQGATRVDDTAAVATLRSIGVAQRMYSLANGGQYATLEELVQGGYLDQSLQSSKDYNLRVVVKPASSGEDAFFSCNADPVGNNTGRHFYIDSTSNQIHVNPNQSASARDDVLQ
ncbi:MAG TPA: hypothetical protein VIB00_15245 [Pyrinomonadaceae bacterium]|jgi:hypothetical protein